MQQIIIIGYVGQPATSQTYSGQVATNFTVAANEKFLQEDGKKGERVTWYNCSLWSKGEPSKIAGYITKGTKVFVQGKPSLKNYTDKNGMQRYSLEIVVSRVELLSSKDDDENGDAKTSPVESPSLPASMGPDTNDDLPF